jgi:hypothetical protein
MRPGLSLPAVLLFVLALLTAVDQRPSRGEVSPADSSRMEFDFWIGDWDLSWADGGKGTNRISKRLDDRVVIEEFDGAPGTPLKGMSVSVFDTLLWKWRQVWVDNSGGYLDFIGGRVDGKMVLQRSAEREGKPILQRMVWYGIARDSLEWNWERSEDGGGTWTVLWKIHYRRKG